MFSRRCTPFRPQLSSVDYDILQLRARVGVGKNLPTPALTPTPAKTVGSGRLQLRSRFQLRSPAFKSPGNIMPEYSDYKVSFNSDKERISVIGASDNAPSWIVLFCIIRHPLHRTIAFSVFQSQKFLFFNIGWALYLFCLIPFPHRKISSICA